MLDTAERPATLGDNNPPPDLLVGDALRFELETNNASLVKRRDELLAAEARIPAIEDDDVAQRVTDFVKQVAAAAKAADTARVGAKEPYLEGGRTVDGFFKHISDPLLDLKKRVEGKLTKYLREKEAAERRRREEEARLAREEEDRLRREREEAERAVRDQQTLDNAIAAETAEQQAAADTVNAEKAAAAKPAELSRTRGEYGGLSSLRTEWTFADLDREEIDLEALRHHLTVDGLEKAVRSFVKAGGRELRGVRIFQDTRAVVR